MHQHRSSTCRADHAVLSIIDDALRSCHVNITNVSINDEQWLQASLPISAEDLGKLKFVKLVKLLLRHFIKCV